MEVNTRRLKTVNSFHQLQQYIQHTFLANCGKEITTFREKGKGMIDTYEYIEHYEWEKDGAKKDITVKVEISFETDLIEVYYHITCWTENEGATFIASRRQDIKRVNISDHSTPLWLANKLVDMIPEAHL